METRLTLRPGMPGTEKLAARANRASKTTNSSPFAAPGTKPTYAPLSKRPAASGDRGKDYGRYPGRPFAPWELVNESAASEPATDAAADP